MKFFLYLIPVFNFCQKEFQKSLKTLKSAIKMNLKHMNSHHFFGVVLESKYNFGIALRFFQKTLKLDLCSRNNFGRINNLIEK